MSTDALNADEPGRELGAAQGAAAVTLLVRMTSAGISDERACGHIARGVVRVAGEPVTDPELALPWPTRWVVGPE